MQQRLIVSDFLPKKPEISLIIFLEKYFENLDLFPFLVFSIGAVRIFFTVAMKGPKKIVLTKLKTFDCQKLFMAKK